MTDKNKGGRPVIELSEIEVAQVGALAQYLSKEQIADYLGVSRPTFDAILERDDRVSEHYKKGKASAIANVAKGLVQKAIGGNMTAAIFYLKTQAGWTETKQVDLNANVQTISDLMDEIAGDDNESTAQGEI